eukprot:gnl/TRDRNA2_/TRDRNA2_92357_c0_seq1.p1 gnl/TRDRNA2_/TRDRNA2_92357_c0~~gnl/TRDRNA2_/TRDRNA2_92357_c0_seq1.p1  ORF type:complete len:377 (-),score=63.34 gnl/TRDRNA2_/TRDRNA2_92357_c0_seq1:82-1212(-)
MYAFTLFCCFAAAVGQNYEEKLIASHRSNFSNAEIWQDSNGIRLELNGDIMSHTSDEHKYHEMLVHPALLAVEKPRHVLVIGGSEGATLREVLRDERVENVTMVDIDQGLVDLCQVHLRDMHQGSFDSPKAQVLYEDGFDFLRRTSRSTFDLVIVDGIDFGGASKAAYGDALFTSAFYQNVLKVLRSGGLLSQYISDRESQATVAMRSAGFHSTLSYGVDIASYKGEGARFVIASNDFPRGDPDDQGGHSLAEILTTKVGTTQAGAQGYTYLNLDVWHRSLAHRGRRLKSGGDTGPGTVGFWIKWVVISSFGAIFAWYLYKCFRDQPPEETEEEMIRRVEKTRGLKHVEADEEEEEENVEEDEHSEEDEGGARCCQ